MWRRKLTVSRCWKPSDSYSARPACLASLAVRSMRDAPAASACSIACCTSARPIPYRLHRGATTSWSEQWLGHDPSSGVCRTHRGCSSGERCGSRPDATRASKAAPRSRATSIRAARQSSSTLVCATTDAESAHRMELGSAGAAAAFHEVGSDAGAIRRGGGRLDRLRGVRCPRGRPLARRGLSAPARRDRASLPGSRAGSPRPAGSRR
jgi:hypothetical protein